MLKREEEKGSHRYISLNPQQTAEIASNVAPLLQPGDIIRLDGEMGAGKSTFARASIQALCGADTEVPSPTFTLVQTYETPKFSLWHFDLYRLEHPEEVYELGIEDAFQRGVSLIEWADRAGCLLSACPLIIEFEYGTVENERVLTFKGWESRGLTE